MAVPKWARENMAKTGGQPTFGVVSKPSLFHSAPVQLADGGDPTEADLKRMGIEASNRYREIERSQEAGVLDKIKGGLRRTWDGITAGNIDAPGSRAYEQYGAGLGRKEYEAEQARKQSVVDTERARKEYVPETAAEISARMGRVPPLGSAVDSKPATSTTEPATTTVTPAKTDSDWEALQRSSENKPVVNTNKPSGVFSEPTKYIGGRTDNQTSKAEEKPAAATRKVVKKKSAQKTEAAQSSRKSSSRTTSDNESRPNKPYPASARPNSQSQGGITDSDVQAAGTKYATLKRTLANAPANTSPTARKALEAAVEEARRDYEEKAKKLKR